MPSSLFLISLLFILAGFTLPASLELLLVTIGLLLPGRGRLGRMRTIRRMKVIIPAHNEELSIARCVSSVSSQTGTTSFETVVIADNCTDGTVQQALSAGARVLIRNAPEQRGKGFALRFAFDALREEIFDAVLVVDADSVVSGNLLEEVSGLLAAGAEAVQCRYLLLNPDQSGRSRLLNIALLAFNVVRPLGRSGWGLSAGILGNGFALSRFALETVPYTADSVVEDLEYHLMLVRAGFQVQFADRATVWGEAPQTSPAMKSQRSRWEGGRLRMAREHVPGLLAEIAKGKVRLIEPLFDLACAPLAYHVAMVAAVFLLPGPIARDYAVLASTIVVAHVLAAAARGGHFLSSLGTLASAPFYLVWKLSTIPALLRGSRNTAPWIRTGRSTS